LKRIRAALVPRKLHAPAPDMGARRVAVHRSCWFVCIGGALVIATLSLLPGRFLRPFHTCIENADKAEHFVIYGFYGAMLFYVYAAHRIKLRVYAVVVVLYCSAYGAGLEYAQKLLLPHDRSFSYGDMTANVLGAYVGVRYMPRYWMERALTFRLRFGGAS
jgi:VanZ family protein